jgi:hypothetical protein
MYNSNPRAGPPVLGLPKWLSGRARAGERPPTALHRTGRPGKINPRTYPQRRPAPCAPSPHGPGISRMAGSLCIARPLSHLHNSLSSSPSYPYLIGSFGFGVPCPCPCPCPHPCGGPPPGGGCICTPCPPCPRSAWTSGRCVSGCWKLQTRQTSS